MLREIEKNKQKRQQEELIDKIDIKLNYPDINKEFKEKMKRTSIQERKQSDLAVKVKNIDVSFVDDPSKENDQSPNLVENSFEDYNKVLNDDDNSPHE